VKSDDQIGRQDGVKGEDISDEEQIARWVRGESVHRRFTRTFVDVNGLPVGTEAADECTPDFSCCDPALLAAPEVRQAFALAPGPEKLGFLGSFLGAMIARMKTDGAELPLVHVAGSAPHS
jgi:hypothetical protein